MRRFGCSKFQSVKKRFGAACGFSMPYRKKRLWIRREYPRYPCRKTPSAAAGFPACEAVSPGRQKKVSGAFIHSNHIEVAMPKHTTEKFSSFAQWLSGRLNLPADMVAKTILLIPPDERRDIKNLRQWRIQVNKYS